MSNFALPDLRGRTPVHVGGGHARAQSGGSASVALTQAQLPEHAHGMAASSAPGTQPTPGGAYLANGGTDLYTAPASLTPMAADAVLPAGGGAPHDNMMPYLALSFCIALHGILPSTGWRRDTRGATLRGRDPDVRRKLPPRRLALL